MTNVTIDLTNFKDRVGSRVQPGKYRVVVDDTELDTARSGNQMINVWFRIIGGDFDGATITDRLVLTEKSMFRVVGFMQALGMPTPRKRLQLNLEKFKNQKMDIVVDDGEPYNGRVKSEVRAYEKIAKSEREEPKDIEDAPEDLPATEASDDSQAEVDLDSISSL